MAKNNRKVTRGTKEWSDYSANCINGCSNNCRYCYAKKMALRFKRKDEDTWKIMEIRPKDVNKKFRHRKGRFMFPTSHDITPDREVMEACFTMLEHILEPGNRVLITTKPHPKVIKELCRRFEKYKDQIQFRFTITSMNDKVLRFWEPNAPKFKNRLKSLKYAYDQGYETSISIEPMLEEPFELIDKLSPFVTGSIWLGIMNHINMKKLLLNETPFYKKIREIHYNLFSIYDRARKDPKVRFKDSIRNCLGLVGD